MIKNNSPSRCGGYWLEVCAARCDKVAHDFRPVVALIPRDFARGVNFDRHDLADTSALDEDDCCADASGAAASLFAARDIVSDEGVAAGDICSGYDVSSLDSKPAEQR